MMDIIKLFLYPDGAWIPGLTFNRLLAGLIYGCFMYHKPIKYWRILLANLTVGLFVNTLMGTLWLSQVYNQGFIVMLPIRMIKNIIEAPIDSLILYMIMQIFRSAGILRMMNVFLTDKRNGEISVK